MGLWGNQDNASGNQKPVFANTSNISVESTINGAVANTDKHYGLVMGVSATEMQAHRGKAQHAGWVSVKYGTGPIKSVVLSNGGRGINSAGYIIATDTSAHGQGTGFNATFTIANSLNSLQSYSSNSMLNTVSSITIVNGGSGFSKAAELTFTTNGDSIDEPVITAVLGGRGDQLRSETLVAMRSIVGDDPRDNVVFSGV
jgi:hypothetical protein